MNDKNNALKTIKEYNNLTVSQTSNILSSFSEVEREKYWRTVSKEMYMTNCIYATTLHDELSIIEGLNASLFTRNLNLNLNNDVENYIRENGSVAQKELANTVKEIRHNLTFKKHSQEDKTRLRQDLIDTEKRLYKSINNLQDIIKTQYKSWEIIRDNLEDDEVAIEFSMYPTDIVLPDKIVPNYGAYIISKDTECPAFVKLCNLDELDSMITNYHPDIEWLNTFYSQNNSQKLYDKIWNNIESHIKDKKNIYISPISTLLTLNMSLLRDENNVMIGDKYNIIQLSSLTSIEIFKKNKRHKYSNACIFGDIDYDVSLKNMEEEALRYKALDRIEIDDLLANRSEDERGKFGKLKYTKDEIEAVKSICSKSNIINEVYSGGKALEEAFKNLSGSSPDIIHMSTHGFVIETKSDYEKNKFVLNTTGYSENNTYMLYTGLLMTGANNIWRGVKCPGDIEDGVLTADEISRLNLKNTKLVVLSACETARGRVDPVEGVLGLQRGFKRAGVGTIVMSLWQVPDKATSILMTLFYNFLTNGNDPRTALKKAQKQLIKTNKNYENPYWWGGFIVID